MFILCFIFQVALSGVEIVNGGYGIKNPLLSNNRINRTLSAQELGKFPMIEQY